jgi:hypothetical protein
MCNREAEDWPKERGSRSFFAVFVEDLTRYVSIRLIAFVVIY